MGAANAPHHAWISRAFPRPNGSNNSEDRILVNGPEVLSLEAR